MISLTPKQADCARVIHELTQLEGRPPTFQAIADELDMHKSSVQRLVDGLEARGWLAARRRGKQRAVALCGAPPPLEECAVVLTEAGLAATAGAA